MSETTEFCPICGEEKCANDTFEQCFDEMYRWYQRYYPHLTREEEVFVVSQEDAKV